jgi:hypothetical protein
MIITEPTALAYSARLYTSSIVPAVMFKYEPLTSPVAADARLIPSIQFKKRSLQRMNGCELMFSSSFKKSKPPFKPSIYYTTIVFTR